MQFTVIGYSFKTLPLAVREALAFSPDDLGPAAERLLRVSGLHEAVVLRTCNRLEIYAVAEDLAAARAGISGFLAAERGLAPGIVAEQQYQLNCQAAVEHLFRVAAGLESRVLGESEILAQIKRAFADAQARGATGPLLNELFMQAAEVGKRVRLETGIARGHTSLAAVAVDAIRDAYPALPATRVLVLGAGQISERAAELLADGRVGQLRVANRTVSRAAAVAARYGGSGEGLDRLPALLAEADAVIVGTSAPGYLIGPAELQAALAGRSRPFVCVDVSVPRNVDPAVAALPGLAWHDLDALQGRIDRSLGDRARAVGHAEELIQEQMGEFLKWLNGLDTTPTIAALNELFDTIRSGEIQRLHGRWSRPLDERDQAVLESITRGIVQKILHGPIMRLKTTADPALRHNQLQAAAALFGISPGDFQQKYARRRDRERPVPTADASAGQVG